MENGCYSCYCVPGLKVFVYQCFECYCYDSEQVRVLSDHQEYPTATIQTSFLACKVRIYPSIGNLSPGGNLTCPLSMSFMSDLTLQKGRQVTFPTKEASGPVVCYASVRRAIKENKISSFNVKGHMTWLCFLKFHSEIYLYQTNCLAV